MYHWREYTFFLWFWSERQEQYQKMIDKGEYHYKNRFDFALRNALVNWKHTPHARCDGEHYGKLSVYTRFLLTYLMRGVTTVCTNIPPSLTFLLTHLMRGVTNKHKKAE